MCNICASTSGNCARSSRQTPSARNSSSPSPPSAIAWSCRPESGHPGTRPPWRTTIAVAGELFFYCAIATSGEDAMLKIWGRANSSNVQKVLWTCEEIGIKFDRIDAGGSFGKTNEPAYLKMNPNGLVPTVEDGDTIIWESNTIMRYLASKHGASRLHPTDLVRRTEVERWMDWQLASVNAPMGRMLFGYYRTPVEQRDMAALEDARKQAIDVWTIAEGALGADGYIAGPDLTLGDIAIGIFVHRWHQYPIERPALPRLKAYYD